MEKCLKHPVFKVIAGVVAEEGLQAFVIGGYVRDLLIGRTSKDIDIVVLGNGIDLARKVAARIDSSLPVSYFKNFGTAMFRIGNDEIEFAENTVSDKLSLNINELRELLESGQNFNQVKEIGRASCRERV